MAEAADAILNGHAGIVSGIVSLWYYMIILHAASIKKIQCPVSVLSYVSGGLQA